jgi:hypothetical protein
MNLTDLAAELQARAADSPPVAGVTRLAGVRERIRARRRKQAGAAIAVTAVCVAAVGLAPALSGLRADPVRPPATSDGKSSPLAFDRDLAGDPLIATAVGPPGQNEVVLRFTPRDANLAISDFCRLPSAAGETGFYGNLTVNGHPIPRAYCSRDAVANQNDMQHSDDPRVNRSEWAKLGLLPGRPSVLRIRFQGPKHEPLTDPEVRLGIGVYELSGARVVSDGITLKQRAEVGGHEYRLAGYLTAKVTSDHRQLTLSVPAGRRPAAILAGNIDVDWTRHPSLRAQVLIDGREFFTIDSDGMSRLALDDARAHTAEFRLDAGITSGSMVLAYYVRSD